MMKLSNNQRMKMKNKKEKIPIPIHRQLQQPNNKTNMMNFHTYFTFFLLLYIFIISNLNNYSATSGILFADDNIAIMPTASNSNLSDNTITTTTTSSTRAKRLGDGCYHVFIDVGANVGVHGRFLLEPEKYPKSKSSVQLFRDEYGEDSTRNNIDYCIFEIEANPKHWIRLDTISNAYKKHKGWKYHIIKAAASDKVGNMTFYHQGTADNKNNEWGFSNVNDYKLEINDTNAYIETVQSIRLSDWIQYHILERIIPELPPSVSLSLSLLNDTTTTTINNNNRNNTSSKPKAVLGMKMDIEGSEYVVLPDLIHSNTICNFDFIFGEYHQRFAPIKQSVGHRVSLNTVEEVKEYERSITQVIESSRNCNVRWLSSDDESYLRDGIPLPE